MSNQNPNETQEAVNQEENQIPELTTEQRLAMTEHYLAEAMKGYQLAGQAINRLESYTFCLVGLILKNEIATFDELKMLQEKLGNHDDLLEFWGVSEQKTEASSEA